MKEKMTRDEWRQAIREPEFFAKEVLGLSLHPGQVQWMQNSNCRENLLVTGNRWGKSFISAVKILYRALFRIRKIAYDRCRKYRIVTASITQDQANIIFNQAVQLARASKILEPLILTITKTPFPKMLFSNGALIESRSTQNRGEYLLGNDYDYFIFDEVAFENDPEYIVEEVIQMRLTDREGMLDLISTPNGKNWFYRRANEIKQKKRRGYFQSGDSRENHFIAVEAFQDRLLNFSERRIHQNIMGQFVDSGGEILKGRYIDYALENYPEKYHEFKQKEDKYYITGWDLARKKTATVGITIQVSDGTAVVVSLVRFQHLDWTLIMEKIKQQQHLFPGRLILDATGLGDVVAQQLSEFNPTSVIFTEAVKAEILTNVEFFHVQKKIFYKRWELPLENSKIWAFEDELREARWDKNNECDSLMALALALSPLYKKPTPVINPKVSTI